MKKTYLQPTIKVVVLKRRLHLLTGSDPQLGGTYGGGTILAPRRGSNSDYYDEDDF